MIIVVVSVLALTVLPVPEQAQIWDSSIPVPRSSDLEQIDGVEFHVIKPFEPDRDRYGWLHGVALAWHRGRLCASYGVNEGGENTATEKVQLRVSDDGGATWTFMAEIASENENYAVSHGVFTERDGRLYAFFGCFDGFRQNVHMRGYLFNDGSGMWEPMGVLARSGFWPMGESQRLSDGAWIIPGISVNADFGQPGNPAAVAICRDGSLRAWTVIPIPRPEDLLLWGESALIVHGNSLTVVARSYAGNPVALASTSQDNGETWTPMVGSNLPMTTSKPYAGTLNNGQHYLICTTTADAGNSRAPLTIAVTKPGEAKFSKIYRIREAVHAGPGESHPNVALSYPYAIEYGGRLFVGYSNDGGRGGNANSAELAVVPVRSMRSP